MNKVAEKTQNTWEEGKDMAKAAMEENGISQDKWQHTLDKGKETLNDTREAVSKSAELVSSKAKQFSECICEYAKNNPWKTIAAAALVGWILGKSR